MGRVSKAGEKQSVGSGKVTPIQIAFIVDRYLTDNNFAATLAAFRAEAAHLFSKTKGKKAPRGLLGLDEILDEYISLKEQRLVVDQEKRRVETALGGIQNVMKAYYSPGAIPLPSSPPFLPPQFVAAHSVSPPPGHTIQAALVMNVAQSPMVPLKAGESDKSSSPPTTSSSSQKRKASNLASGVPVAPKKSRTQSSNDSAVVLGSKSPFEATCSNKVEENAEKHYIVPLTSLSNPIIKPPVQVSTVAKSLFSQHPESQAKFSSPRTPQTLLDKSLTSVCSSSLETNHADTSKEIASTNCSIMSSKTIIVSPLKHSGYYAVKRSYHVSSPLKLNTKLLNKRDHVKGRLDFDEFDVPRSSEKPVAANSSTSSTDEGIQEDFDFDFSDIDLFNGDFSFSEFLGDFDMDCEEVPCHSGSTPANPNSGSEPIVGNGSLEVSTPMQCFCLPAMTEVLPEKGMKIQSPDPVTSMKTVTTKCIVLSPSKRRYSTLDQTTSAA